MLTISNQLRVTEPDKRITEYCKDKLTISNPEYAKKVRLGLWTGSTPKQIKLYSKDGDDVIIPYGCLSDVIDYFDYADIKTELPTPTRLNYGKYIPLYDYQETAVKKMIDARFGILQSAAGSGKTQMGLALIQRLGKKALWLTHTKDLLVQSKARAEQYMDKSIMGTITEGKVEIGKGITFATVQTMCNLDLSLYRDVWDVVVVDECHRCCGTATSVTMFSKILNNLSARHKYGLSATVHRADGLIQATFSLIGPVQYIVPEEATAKKTMQVTIQPIQTGVELTNVCFNYDGTLKFASMLTFLATNEWRNELITRYLIMNRGHSILVLSSRLEQLRILFDKLPYEMKSDAVMIDGSMTSKKAKAEREQAIEDMRTGNKHILFASYGLAKEGLDIPCLDRLFLATPEKDYAVITQSIGRIARTCDGKGTPVCYDFVDAHSVLASMCRKRYQTYKKNKCIVNPFE